MTKTRVWPSEFFHFLALHEEIPPKPLTNRGVNMYFFQFWLQDDNTVSRRGFENK